MRKRKNGTGRQVMVDTQGANEKVTKGGGEREGGNTFYARLTLGVPLLCYL